MNKVILILPFLLLLSCSIQKRKYQNGYYVDWNHKRTLKEKTNSAQTNSEKSAHKTNVLTETRVSTGDRPNLMEATLNTLSEGLKLKGRIHKNPGDSCDLLIFKDGSEIKAKVEEVGVNEIKYKRCDSPDGPIYVTKKSDIFMIKYVNGTKEVIKSDPVVSPYQAPANSYKSNKYKRINHPLALPAVIMGGASVALGYILGMVALIEGIAGAYLVIPFILGIIAVALGATAMTRIKEQPDVYKGKGMAIPGMIMGLVIACIYALIGLMFLLFA